MCVEHGVQSYPTSILYKHGEVLESIRGGKGMDILSAAIETALEEEKPGTRPANLLLPEPGAKDFDPVSAQSQAEELPVAHEGNDLNDGRSTSQTNGKSPQEALREIQENSRNPAKSPSDQKAINEADLPAKQSANTDKDAGKTEKTEDSTSGNPISKWKAPTSAELFNQRKPKQPATPPNQNGVSVALTAESFQRLVTMTQDPWFIKFYAPWCPHCQAMSATWDQLAKTMRGKLNIGEVNCDKESRLCKDVHARSYPTILFFKGGERSEFHGLRGLGDFVDYAENALDLASGVPDVDAAAFELLEKKEDVIFTYFYDHATTTEDFTALERIPLSLIGHAKLVKTNDPALFERFKITTWPRLIVSREGRPSYYTPLTPNEMRDVHKVLDWMKTVWLPLVPELTASNARQIMQGKIVVLAILNKGDTESFTGAVREMKNAAAEWMDRQVQEFQLERKKLRDAKQMRIEEAEDRDDERALRAAKQIRIDMDAIARKEVGFAWVDGVFWQRWIRQTYGVDVKDGERVIINDEDVSFLNRTLRR
jgi:protein disulfide-isomerase